MPERKPIAERIMDHVVRVGTCWEWTAARDRDGYGRIQHDDMWSMAHRVAFAAFRGELAVGYEVDHLCRNRACVNPDHLEAVTRAENNTRKWATYTHCKHGHEYTPENTHVGVARDGTSYRTCRACRREAARKARRRALTIPRAVAAQGGAA